MKPLLLILLTVCSALANEDAKSLLKKYTNAIEDKDTSKIATLIYSQDGDKKILASRLSRLQMKFNTEGFKVTSTKLVPLPNNFSSTTVSKGFSYKPNVTPTGMIELAYKTDLSETPQKTLSLYGEIDGRFYIAGIKKEDLNWEGEEDKWLSYKISPKITGINILDPSTYKVKVYFNASGVDLETVGSSSKRFNGQYITQIELSEPLQQDDVEITISERSGKVTQEIAKVKANKGATVLYQRN